MAWAGHQCTGLDLAPNDISVPFCSSRLTLQPQLPAASCICPQKRRHPYFSCSLLVSFTLFTTPSPCHGQLKAKGLPGSSLAHFS